MNKKKIFPKMLKNPKVFKIWRPFRVGNKTQHLQKIQIKINQLPLKKYYFKIINLSKYSNQILYL